MARSTASRRAERFYARTITVRELIEALEGEEPEMPVVFSSNYGDLSNTPQVHALAGECEEVELEETAYSVTGWAIRNEDDEPDDDEDAPRVLVIR